MKRLDDVQDSTTDTKLFQHLPQHSTRYSIESFLETNKTTTQLASFSLLSCPSLFVYQRPQNEYIVSHAEVLSEACPLASNLTPCFSAVEAILCSRIIANSLTITEPTVIPL